VQHGFAADAAVEQGVDSLGGLAPGAFQLDLGVEAAACGQGAQARQIAGTAGVRGELAGEVQRVDPRLRARSKPLARKVTVSTFSSEAMFTSTLRGARCSIASPNLAPPTASMMTSKSPPSSAVSVSGTAATSADADELLLWATRIGPRYMGMERAAEFGRRNAVPPELVVRVTATRIVANAGIAD
jgi:hypothetical protein